MPSPCAEYSTKNACKSQKWDKGTGGLGRKYCAKDKGRRIKYKLKGQLQLYLLSFFLSTAERVGFEPTDLIGHPFSRRTHSATLPSLHAYSTRLAKRQSIGYRLDVAQR
jgi:hypothetical protein